MMSEAFDVDAAVAEIVASLGPLPDLLDPSWSRVEITNDDDRRE